MVECDSHETPNMYPHLSAPLSDQRKITNEQEAW